MTVLDVIQRSTEFLAQKGVESPRLQTELLLAHVLQKPRMQLYLNFERELSAVELEQLRQLVKRRGRREPVQQIIGSTSFCGLEIRLNEHVLIPRPETELLAEFGWQFLNQLGNNGGTAPTALEIGVGSGCVAIALAAHCPSLHIDAVDISPQALELTRRNAEEHHVSDRIRTLQGDRFAALPSPARYQLIISNPPYIATAEIDSLQPEVRDHDPRLALDGGADGLDFYHYFATEARSWLSDDGKLMLEFGDGQAEFIKKIFEAQKWIVEQVAEDYTQRPRVLIVK